jgi:hypothetical protein
MVAIKNDWFLLALRTGVNAQMSTCVHRDLHTCSSVEMYEVRIAALYGQRREYEITEPTTMAPPMEIMSKRSQKEFPR